jgi:transposase
LHRARRGYDELAKEFGCTSWSIRQWVKQAERNSGRSDGGLTTAERRELTRLRRENRQLKLEREILSKAAAWEARMAVFEWLQGWYGLHRRHSSLGYLSPIHYERKLLANETVPT